MVANWRRKKEIMVVKTDKYNSPAIQNIRSLQNHFPDSTLVEQKQQTVPDRIIQKVITGTGSPE